MSIYPEIPFAVRKIPGIGRAEAEICLVYDLKDGVPLSFIQHNDFADNSVFAGLTESLSPILTHDSIDFFLRHRSDPRAHYIFLLTRNGDPLWIVTSFVCCSGLCVVIAPKLRPNVVLSFLNSIPQIPYFITPEFQSYTPRSSNNRIALKQFELLFCNAFSFFEVGFGAPLAATDTLTIFTKMQQKLAFLLEDCGFSLKFRMQQPLHRNFQADALPDSELYALTILLLSAALKNTLDGNTLEIVFFETNRAPSVCIHYPISASKEIDQRINSFLQSLYAANGAFFRSVAGIYLPRELEAIPAVLKLQKESSIGIGQKHVFTVFTPVRTRRASMHFTAPLFRLPSKFFGAPAQRDSFDSFEALLKYLCGENF